MEAEFSPEPTPEEREALLRALAALEQPADTEHAWWRAGIDESAEDEPDY
jgi:hypothetical protein